MRRGFTLVEVVVALLVLQVGLLGGLAILTMASRTLRRAVTVEVAVAALEGVADSLLSAGWTGDGRMTLDAGEISWSGAPDSAMVLAFEPTGGGRDAIRIRLEGAVR